VFTHSHTFNMFDEFQKFVQKFGKTYGSLEEYTQAFENFSQNMRVHLTHTSQHKLTYETGPTRFWDMSFEEFQKTYLNLHVPSVEKFIKKAKPMKATGIKPDPEHDWRKKGSVGPVKDQGACGSCWAFSIVGNLEGVHHIKHKKLHLFSEQQIVDCDTKDFGCGGGWMEWGMEYIQSQGGLELQDDYPYVGVGQTCAFDETKVAVKVTGNHFAKSQDEEDIKEFVFTTGPLSVALNANVLFSYQSGIIDVPTDQCDPKALNHGVTMVGYGTEDGKDFWILKNSWNESFGEKGYFRLARGKGLCGINTYVITAEVA